MTAISVGTPRLRLTRRGRVVFTTLAAGPLAVMALVMALNGGIATATSVPSSSEPSTGTFEYVTVASGQSLWQLAETIAPAADPRDVISDIVRLNQLESSVVHPGERLAVPAAYSR